MLVGIERQTTHIFWGCHKLHQIWENWNVTVKDILGCAVPNNFKIKYLGYTNDCVVDYDTVDTWLRCY